MPSDQTQVTPTTASEPLTTNMPRCEVCSVEGENNQACSTISDCIPQTPKAYVEVGSSAVHVGTLTSEALSTSISSALASLCPEVTQAASMTNCSDEVFKIGGIAYKNLSDNELYKNGELQVNVTAGQYNTTSIRDAMIDSAALTAMQSATGSNCYEEHYDSGGLRSDRRSILDISRRWLGLENREAPAFGRVPSHETLCQAARFVGVQYLPPYAGQCSGLCTPEKDFMWLDAEWDFHEPPGNQKFDCDFIAGLIDALAAVQPEFAVTDVGLSEAIDAACKAVVEKVH